VPPPFFRLESMGTVTLKPVTDQSSELYIEKGYIHEAHVYNKEI